jgi:hypothetical protein
LIKQTILQVENMQNSKSIIIMPSL